MVAATHRSGSYLACDWLSQLGGVPFPEEYFNFNLLAARQELLLSDDLSRSEVLGRIMTNQCNSHGMFAVKAMWPAFESLFANLAMERGLPARDYAEMAFDSLGELKVLFIRRKDKVRQSVSFEKAKQAGTWRKHKGELVADEALVYSYSHILNSWNQIHEDESAWLKFFETHRLPYYEIWYEDMVEDPMGVIGAALKFLNVVPNTDVHLQSRFQKLGGGINLDWAERFTRRRSCALNADTVMSDSESLELRASVRCLQQGPIRLSPDSATVVECEITNEGQLPWVPVENESGQSTFSLQARSERPHTADADDVALWTTELESVVLPGDTVTLPLRLVVGVVPEDFQFDLILCHPQGEICLKKAMKVEIELDEKWRFLRKVFVELFESDLTGWVRVPALGDLWTDSFPFIYQKEHGWLNVDLKNSSPGTFCAIDFALGYFAVHLNRPREFYVFGDTPEARRLDFKGVSNGLREFEDAETGETLRYALSRGPDS
jgi:LPS sulfotransferase NodH